MDTLVVGVVGLSNHGSGSNSFKQKILLPLPAYVTSSTVRLNFQSNHQNLQIQSIFCRKHITLKTPVPPIACTSSKFSRQMMKGKVALVAAFAICQYWGSFANCEHWQLDRVRKVRVIAVACRKRKWNKYCMFTGWWFQRIWKILVKMVILPQIGVNIKKSLKPPPSLGFASDSEKMVSSHHVYCVEWCWYMRI